MRRLSVGKCQCCISFCSVVSPCVTDEYYLLLVSNLSPLSACVWVGQGGDLEPCLCELMCVFCISC